jgi:uncharacterized protein YbaR (Trm112 family)/SAM-dependent methyltransferase
MPISPAVAEMLRCPVCHERLVATAEAYRCTGTSCGKPFPVVAGVPILLNEERSVFRIGEVIASGEPRPRTAAGIRRVLASLTPDISENRTASQTFTTLRDLLAAQTPAPRVLIVGGGTLGVGTQILFTLPSVDFVETDVTLGPRVALVCDAHDLPFADGAFHGVVAQAVLEHVVDPERCVAEMHRVLVKDGLVYAETPFMQQVHLGAFDFTRYTHLGHRRLFRWFVELDSGPTGGPGMALAWSYLYFLLSFSRTRVIRAILRRVAALTAFPLKYFDRLLNRRPGAYDAASGYYFLGRKSATPFSDRSLIEGYKGVVGASELGNAP